LVCHIAVTEKIDVSLPPLDFIEEIRSMADKLGVTELENLVFLRRFVTPGGPVGLVEAVPAVRSRRAGKGHVQLPHKAGEVAMLEVQRQDGGGKFLGPVNDKTSALRAPVDQALMLLV
jgi:hypothetical protein